MNELTVTAARGEIGRYVCTDEASVHHGCVLGDPNGIADSVVLAISRTLGMIREPSRAAFTAALGAVSEGEYEIASSVVWEALKAAYAVDSLPASKGEVEAVAREMRISAKRGNSSYEKLLAWADRLSPRAGEER